MHFYAGHFFVCSIFRGTGANILIFNSFFCIIHVWLASDLHVVLSKLFSFGIEAFPLPGNFLKYFEPLEALLILSCRQNSFFVILKGESSKNDVRMFD